MVLNYPSKSQKYGQTQIHKSMNKNTYPKQNEDFIDKVMPISFRNERDKDTIFRLNWSETLQNYKIAHESIFYVLRFDAEYPYKVILINALGVVIVSTTDRILNLPTPNGVYIQNRFQESSSFFNRKFAPFNYQDGYNPNNDFVELYSTQNKEYLGLNGYTEYENDLVTEETIPTREAQSIVQEQPDYHSVERRAADVSRIYPKEAYTYANHPEVLSGFPYSHYIHDKNYIDKPFATKNSAKIIRADMNKDYLVVMERVKDKNNNTILRFLTGEEVYFYYKSEDQYRINYEFDTHALVKEIKEGQIQL